MASYDDEVPTETIPAEPVTDELISLLEEIEIHLGHPADDE